MSRLPGERFVGVFLLLAAGAVAAVAVAVGTQKNLFEDRYHYTARFNRGHGLAEGTGVYVVDIEAGGVRSIEPGLGNDGRLYVEVGFDVREGFLPYLKEDSVASVSALTVAGEFIGGKVLEIRPGSRDSKLLRPGSEMISLDSEEGQALLGRTAMGSLPGEVEDLIHHASELLSALNDEESSLRRAMGALDDLGEADLPEAIAQVRSLVDELAGAGELAGTLRSLQDLLARVSDEDSSLGHLLVDDAELYKSIAVAMESLNKASVAADGTFGVVEGQTVPALGGSMDELTVSMRQMRDVMSQLETTIVDLNRVLGQAEHVLGSVEQTRFIQKHADDDDDR